MILKETKDKEPDVSQEDTKETKVRIRIITENRLIEIMLEGPRKWFAVYSHRYFMCAVLLPSG